MDKLDIVLWAMGLGFSFNFGLMWIMWIGLNGRMERLEQRIDKLDEKITDIDRRLCRIEGSMSAKECCMLKETHHPRKAQ